MPNSTIQERLDDISPLQRSKIKEVFAAKQARDRAADEYAKKIKEANDAGVSYGMLGQELGIPRETLFRQVERWMKRMDEIRAGRRRRKRVED